MVSVAKLSRELAYLNPTGEKWYKLFRAGQAKISDRIYQNLSRLRANVTQENLNK